MYSYYDEQEEAERQQKHQEWLRGVQERLKARKKRDMETITRISLAASRQHKYLFEPTDIIETQSVFFQTVLN